METETAKEAAQFVRQIMAATQTTKTNAKKIAAELQRVSTVVRYYYPEMSPFDYQAEWIDDFTTKWRCRRKARQVGHSKDIGQGAMARAIAIPNYQHIFCSLNLEDANEKIVYARELYEAIRTENGRVPSLVENRKKAISLSNGSRLISTFKPRGRKKANISLDEFAWVSNAMEVYTAALPILVHAGTQLDIGSSESHGLTMFADIFEGRDGKYSHFVRSEVFWWDCPIHCINVPGARRECPGLDTETRVRQFGSPELREIFDNMPIEQFQQEFELRRVDDSTALLPWRLILDCTPTGDRAIDRYDSIQELATKTKGRPIYGGYDVGRWKDAGELTVFSYSNGMLHECYFVSFEKRPFDEQEAEVFGVLSLPNCRGLAIDKTGMGEQMAERAQQRFPSRVEPVHFTSDSKATLATTIKLLMERNEVRFYPDKRRNYQMHSIKKEVSDRGVIQYNVVREGGNKFQHHGDVFWSRALACYVFASQRALGKPNIRILTL